MSTDKTDAVVIRLVDFSESSKVVTLFTREFGKVSGLAKGAKRLKSAFELSIDLLSECRVVLLRKSGSTLDLVTESKLIHRFQPLTGSLSHLYAGYYVAELLNALTEEDDPHIELYKFAVHTLKELESTESIFIPVTRFELALLREMGQLPDFDTCTICHSELHLGDGARFWVSQSGLICSQCGRSEYDSTEIHSGTLALLRKLLGEDDHLVSRLVINERQKKELRRLVTSAVTYVLGKRPKTLPMLRF
ncbi:MAG: DNA repair protein RecO [Planctomycetaceae bacterium]|nr:DNA repair protein RecO [Planctomycetaceae bacterium]